MISNLKSVSKRQKTETKAGQEKSTSTDDIADSASIKSEEPISRNDDSAFNAVFTEDILPEILDNLEILTPKDLLTFRLVNRCWRDAATSVILTRNLCEIGLDFGKVGIDEDGNEVGQVGGYTFNPDGTLAVEPTSYSAYKYFNVSRPESFLSDLNQLISTSLKFPCDSFYFDTECRHGFRNLCQPSDSTDADQHRIDLLHFFSLYGKKIRKLTLSAAEISKEAVQNLLYVHMPHLVCLNIQDVDDILTEDKSAKTNEESEMQVCPPPPSASMLNIEKVILGYISLEPPADTSNFVIELISVSPKLRIIEDVHASSLEVLLEIKKCHLVHELHFDDPLPTSLQFKKLLTDSIFLDAPSVPRLQLSKLTVSLSDLKSSHEHDAIVKGLNLILSASKNSLQYFEFRMIPSDNVANLFIPPLPQLKYLKLEDSIDSRLVTTRFHFLRDVIGQAVQTEKLNADPHSVDDFKALLLQNQGNVSNIPEDYFPRLRQVELCSEKTRECESDKLMEFFAVEYLQRSFCLFIPEEIIPGDTLSTVTTLELTRFAWFDRAIAKSFPCVSDLTIHCQFSNTPQNWVWTAFPQLERFEITGIPESWDAKFVDSFFTGISAKLCSQFRMDATSLQLTGRRTKPYIGDCKNLKEFKVGFDFKLTSIFASKVAAVHGFSQVAHRTKIIFSFESEYFRVLREEEIPETRQVLDPVADYIEFRV